MHPVVFLLHGYGDFAKRIVFLRLGSFSREEIRELYMQHTRETGQEFDEACFPMVWEATEGQPWLVNALGREVTWSMRENRDRSVRIIPEMIYRAQERIIYRRDTHIDILIDKLREERVKRVIQPMLSGEGDIDDEVIPSDDIQYVADMGLITIERGKPRRIANGIYREIIPRELTWSQQTSLTQESQWYERADGGIDVEKLLRTPSKGVKASSYAMKRKGRCEKERGQQLHPQAEGYLSPAGAVIVK